MNLVDALHPELPARIAIVGGGGKTTALFQLARQIPGFTWVSTTTHLGTDQLNYTDKHFIVRSVDDDNVEKWLQQKSTLLTGEFTEDERVKGPGETLLAQIYQAAEAKKVSLVIEADGSRSRPLKAPGINEPAIPPWAELVITVAGLSVLGQVFSEATVHRVEPFKQITGLREGQPITLECITRLLASPLGGLKNSPVGAVKTALLNQADTKELCEQAASYAPALLAAGYDIVLIGSLKNAPDELLCFHH
jgi:probable selenium-dependent hydroxylase accessory protein YqeC